MITPLENNRVVGITFVLEKKKDRKEKEKARRIRARAGRPPRLAHDDFGRLWVSL